MSRPGQDGQPALAGTGGTGHRLALIGASTATTGDPLSLRPLRDLGAECLEVRACSATAWTAVASEIARLDVPVGLHCPLPFDGVLKEFEITGPDEDRQRAAMALVGRTASRAADTGAAWVTVHFPSARARLPCWPGATRSVTRAESDAGPAAGARTDPFSSAAHALSELAVRYRVPMLLENMSYHEQFGSAPDYARICRQNPALELCLDVGHVRLSPHAPDTVGYVSELREHIRAAHVYSLPTGPAGPTGPRTAPSRDLAGVLAAMTAASSAPGPVYLLLEYREHERRAKRLARAMNEVARMLGRPC